MRPPTHTREDALGFAGAVAGCCVGVLGATVEVAIVHGSLTLGDYVPGRSDVDVLVVCDTELADAQATAVVAALAPLQRVAPAAADLRIVTREVAAAPTPAPLLELGVELGRARPPTRRAPEPDLVVELSVCRAHGRSLLGPPPDVLLAPVPDAWVLAVGEGYVHAWNEQTASERADHRELIAFTACRAWRFAVDGRHCAKSEAAAWVLERAPDLDAVRRALQRRHGGRPRPVDDAALLRLLAAAREGVAAARRLESVRHPE